MKHDTPCPMCGRNLGRQHDCQPPEPPSLILPGSRDVCRATGLTYRQVDYILRTRRVIPTVDAYGSGNRRGFTLDDAVALVVCNHAMSHGIEVDPRAPPESVEVAPGLTLTFDVAAIRAQVTKNWPSSFPKVVAA